MTIVDFISTAPIWIKIILALLALYIITWLPRVISGFNKIIHLLNTLNAEMTEHNELSRENLKYGFNSRVTADLMAKMLATNKKNENKENKNV